MDTTPGLRDMLNTPRPVTKKATAGTKRPKEADTPAEHDESYDPRKREPQYAHAEKTCLWELVCCFIFSVFWSSSSYTYLGSPPKSLSSLCIPACSPNPHKRTSHGHPGPRPQHALTLPRPLRVQEPEETKTARRERDAACRGCAGCQWLCEANSRRCFWAEWDGKRGRVLEAEAG